MLALVCVSSIKVDLPPPDPCKLALQVEIGNGFRNCLDLGNQDVFQRLYQINAVVFIRIVELVG